MALSAPLLLALFLAAAPGSPESVGAVVAPAARDLGLRIDAPGALSILDWNDPEELRPRGLGDGPARRPVQAFETALCELSVDPRLGASILLPGAAPDAPSSDLPADGAGPAPSRCGQAVTDVATSPFRRTGADAGETASDRWTRSAGVTVTPTGPAEQPAPAAGRPVSPLAWGEFSTHPGLIQQPPPPARARGDKVSYQVLRDTTLGFDGHLLRLRLTYPRLDPP